MGVLIGKVAWCEVPRLFLKCDKSELQKEIAMRLLLTTILCLWCLSATGLIAVGIAQTTDQSNLTVTTKPQQSIISGAGEVKVQADQVLLQLNVITEDHSLQKAIVKNRSKRQTLVTELIKIGIDKGKINVSRFSWTPEMGWFGDKAKNYKITNQIQIIIVDEEQFIQCAVLIDKYKEIHYLGLSYNHSQSDQHKLRALEKACENAVQKKDIFQKTLGVELKPIYVTEQRVWEERLQDKSTQMYLMRQTSYLKEASVAMQTGESGLNTSFGQITYKATVVVGYQRMP